MEEPAVVAEGITKRFGTVEALAGIDLQVQQGAVFGLLGPNGAGKTTAVRIFTTLLTPDAGRATVAGYDVVRDAEALRAKIGLAGQFAAVDENLTGLENLEMVGRLYHLDRAEARSRAEDVLERFGLSHAASRTAKTYSGGMRRRLDLGASLVGRPTILFMDEPTTGLDPRSRFGLWDVIRELQKDGTTLLLTTQYMEEADSLADRIAVIDGGKVIAEGTSGELKARVGGEVLEIRLLDRGDASKATGAVFSLGPGGAQVDNEAGELTIPVGNDGASVLTEAVRRLDAEGVKIADLQLRRPTLDDVFLALTGHGAETSEMGEDDEAGQPTGRAARRKRKART